MFRSPVKIETLHFRNGPCYWPNKLSNHPRWDHPFQHTKHQSQCPTSNTPNHTIHWPPKLTEITVANQGVGLGSRITGSNKIWWWASILGHVDPKWIYYSKSNLIQNMLRIYPKENLRTNSIIFNPHGHGSGDRGSYEPSFTTMTVDPNRPPLLSRVHHLWIPQGAFTTAKTGHPKWGVTNGLNGGSSPSKWPKWGLTNYLQVMGWSDDPPGTPGT